MLILGATSDISKAFAEHALQQNPNLKNLHLVSSNQEQTNQFAKHLEAKYQIKPQVHTLNLMQDFDTSFLQTIDFDTVLCATGYLGLDTEKGLYNHQNTEQIVNINYGKLILVLNDIAKILEQKQTGTMIILSSVAGDRGRQSNFVYGSAKAAITAYASGLRNYLSKKGVHVLTVKPGFMDTKMTQDLTLPKPLTAQPKAAAKAIYKAAKAKKNVVYVLWMWRFIMLIIKNIPEFIFKKMKL